MCEEHWQHGVSFLLWALTGVSGWSPRSWCLQLLFEEINGGLWVSPQEEVC